MIGAVYRGNINIVLFNHGNLYFHATTRDCIAHLLFKRIESPPVVVVTQLLETKRGSMGFE